MAFKVFFVVNQFAVLGPEDSDLWAENHPLCSGVAHATRESAQAEASSLNELLARGTSLEGLRAEYADNMHCVRLGTMAISEDRIDDQGRRWVKFASRYGAIRYLFIITPAEVVRVIMDGERVLFNQRVTR